MLKLIKVLAADNYAQGSSIKVLHSNIAVL